MDEPLVILTDANELDPEPAADILRAAGLRLEVLQLDVDPVVPDRVRTAVAAISGYAVLGPEFYAALPDLEFIATASAGFEMVNPVAAERAGVTIQPLQGAATREVATHELALILALERELRDASRPVAAGGWTESFQHMPRPLDELTLGLIGVGKIGRELARVASPLFARVIGCDPNVVAPVPHVAALVSLDELLRSADVITLQLPLTDETRHIIAGPEITAMKPGTTLVNISRGAHLDVPAVLAGLDSGHLRALGVDVLDGEPPRRDDPLRTHPRVLATPHVAYLSSASWLRYLTQPAENVVAWWRSRQR